MGYVRVHSNDGLAYSLVFVTEECVGGYTPSEKKRPAKVTPPSGTTRENVRPTSECTRRVSFKTICK